MSKEMSVIVLGILMIVTPFLGVPGTWKTAIFVLVGLAIAGLGFLLRGEALSRQGTGEHHPFIDNTSEHEEPPSRPRISSLN